MEFRVKATSLGLPCLCTNLWGKQVEKQTENEVNNHDIGV